MSRINWFKRAAVEAAYRASDTCAAYTLPTDPCHRDWEVELRPLRTRHSEDGSMLSIIWNCNDIEIHTDIDRQDMPVVAKSGYWRMVVPKKGPVTSYSWSYRRRGESIDSAELKKPDAETVLITTQYNHGYLRFTDSVLILSLPSREAEYLLAQRWFSIQFNTDNGAVTVLVDRMQDVDTVMVLSGPSVKQVCKASVSAAELLMIYDLDVTWPQSAYEYMSLKRTLAMRAIRTLNRLKRYRIPGKPWARYDNLYKHWAIPKHGKDGYRLISAPRGGLKTEAAAIHKALAHHGPLVDGGTPLNKYWGSTLSYCPGIDYVKTLAEKHLSIENSGRYCLQVDLKDYFTNLKPATLAALFRTSLTEKQLYYLFLEGAPLLGFVKVMNRLTDLDYSDLSTIKQGLLEMFTTPLPLWKRELGGYDIEACDGSLQVNGVSKHDVRYKNAIIKPRNFEKIANLHKTVAPYVPLVQRGVPQGSSFSGDIANLAGAAISRLIQHALGHILEDFRQPKCWAGMETIVYSDNLYVFYNAPFNMANILKRELPEAVYRNLPPDACIKNLLKPWKIMNFDREKADVKLLGLILDKDGNVRLSRRYRRKINQKLIAVYKGQKTWDQTDEGQKNWYLHVKKYMGGNYARSLKDGSEPKPNKVDKQPQNGG